MRALSELVRRFSPVKALAKAAHGDDGAVIAFPEGFQTLNSSRRRVAGDDRSIDRANRDAGHPIGQVLGCRKSFINASLVAAKGSSALQDERNLLVVGCRASGHLQFTHMIIAHVCSKTACGDSGKCALARAGGGRDCGQGGWGRISSFELLVVMAESLYPV